MKAVLLATSEPNKLAPLAPLALPLLPVANQPVMLYNIDLLARQGYRSMLVCLHHQAGAIERHFQAGQRWGVQLDYVLQRDDLGSAGSLGWARNLLNETMLVLPADSLLDLDIAALLEQHRSQGNVATMVMHPARTGAGRKANGRPNLGCPELKMPASAELPEGTEWCATGAAILEPQALGLIPPRTPFDLLTQLVPALLAAGLPVGAHPMYGYWNPLNSFIAYQMAQEDLMRSHPSYPTQDRQRLKFLQLNRSPLRPGIWIGRNSAIHPTAHITPPVLIGENCRIGREVDLGPNTILGDNVILDDGVTIHDSLVFEHTYLGRLVKVQDRVVRPGQLIDIPTGQGVKIVDPQLVAATPPTIEQSPLRRWLEVALALILLALSLPLSLALALLSALAYGRVFQPVTRLRPAPARLGEHDLKTFRLLRFATTRKDGAANGLGRWLERWQLNRLPELWNVVSGELNVVGIHPVAPEELMVKNDSEPIIPWRQSLTDCPPGITGLWFVQAGPHSPLEEIQLADAYYNATRSWSGDLAILRQTPSAWVRQARQASAQTLENQLGHQG